MGNLVGYKSESVAAPTTAGSGWAPGVTDAGYLTKGYHFYPKGETRSVCQGRFRKSRALKPKQQLPQNTEYHKKCEDWIAAHPNGGKRKAS